MLAAKLCLYFLIALTEFYKGFNSAQRLDFGVGNSASYAVDILIAFLRFHCWHEVLSLEPLL